MTTFIEEVNQILWSTNPEQVDSTVDEATQRFLNLVSERIIGEPVKLGADGLRESDGATINNKLDEQRTTLYEGTKEETDE